MSSSVWGFRNFWKADANRYGMLVSPTPSLAVGTIGVLDVCEHVLSPTTLRHRLLYTVSIMKSKSNVHIYQSD